MILFFFTFSSTRAWNHVGVRGKSKKQSYILLHRGFLVAVSTRERDAGISRHTWARCWYFKTLCGNMPVPEKNRLRLIETSIREWQHSNETSQANWSCPVTTSRGVVSRLEARARMHWTEVLLLWRQVILKETGQEMGLKETGQETGTERDQPGDRYWKRPDRRQRKTKKRQKREPVRAKTQNGSH